jgi:hypothetical protein
MVIRSAGILALFAFSVIGTVEAQQPAIGATEMFAAINGKVGAGIVFDDKGGMYVGKNGAILKVAPNGSVSQFCDLTVLPSGPAGYGFRSPLAWEMIVDPDGSIVVAAQDRILRVAPDGSVTTLIEDGFDSFVGGIARDKAGNLYVANGARVFKFTPQLEKSVFLDATGAKIPIHWQGMDFDEEITSFWFMALDPEGRNFYLSEFNHGMLLKYPIRSDGTPESPIVLLDSYTDDLSQAPLNVVFGDKGNIYVSNDISARIIKIDASGKKTFIPLPPKTRNHLIAFGGKGFAQGYLYFTTLDGDAVYRTYVGENALMTR